MLKTSLPVLVAGTTQFNIGPHGVWLLHLGQELFAHIYTSCLLEQMEFYVFVCWFGWSSGSAFLWLYSSNPLHPRLFILLVGLLVNRSSEVNEVQFPNIFFRCWVLSMLCLRNTKVSWVFLIVLASIVFSQMFWINVFVGVRGCLSFFCTVSHWLSAIYWNDSPCLTRLLCSLGNKSGGRVWGLSQDCIEFH